MRRPSRECRVASCELQVRAASSERVEEEEKRGLGGEWDLEAGIFTHLISSTHPRRTHHSSTSDYSPLNTHPSPSRCSTVLDSRLSSTLHYCLTRLSKEGSPSASLSSTHTVHHRRSTIPSNTTPTHSYARYYSSLLYSTLLFTPSPAPSCSHSVCSRSPHLAHRSLSPGWPASVEESKLSLSEGKERQLSQHLRIHLVFISYSSSVALSYNTILTHSFNHPPTTRLWQLDLISPQSR